MTKANDRYDRNGRARCPQRAVWRYGGTPPNQCGFTIYELMVTMVIVSVLAATVGTFFVKLLNIQEREREEAYVREKLSDICGAYADMLSVGSSIITSDNPSNQTAIVKYRQETGGVSLETGVVTRVAYLTSMMTNSVMDMDILSLAPGEEELDKKFLTRLTRRASGNAALIPLLGDMVSCTLRPLGTAGQPEGKQMNEVDDYLSRRVAQKGDHGFEMTDAALGWLEVKARYAVKDDEGMPVSKTVMVERVVRLWNRD